MKFTRHRFRLAIGTLICSLGLVLCFSPGLLFYRLADGGAWLYIGAVLCFVPEFHLRLTRDWFTRALGLLMAGAGFLFTAGAVWAIFGPRAHGLLPFYEFIGIGPLLLFTGVLICFDKKKAG